MKAARFRQFGGPGVPEIVDLHDPHPGPGQADGLRPELRPVRRL